MGIVIRGGLGAGDQVSDEVEDSDYNENPTIIAKVFDPKNLVVHLVMSDGSDPAPDAYVPGLKMLKGSSTRASGPGAGLSRK